MFYPEGLVDFASEKSFIPKLTFFLLHRCVQKWLFAKYCPHFSFITLEIVLHKKNSHVNLKIIRQSDSNFKINFDNYSLFWIWNSLLALASIESQTFTTVIFFCKLIYAIITRQKVTKKNIVPTPLLKMKFYLPRPKLNC